MTENGFAAAAREVVRCDAIARSAIERLLARYGLMSHRVGLQSAIPGSYWGPPEAGLISNGLYWRGDTPLHSLLHELAHYVCMDPTRRARLDTDAGGTDIEECAVCYLEVLLAGHLAPFGAERCLDDMDAWGYSFREGSARAWFSGDGGDARAWLLERGLLRADGEPIWKLRHGCD